MIDTDFTEMKHLRNTFLLVGHFGISSSRVIQ